MQMRHRSIVQASKTRTLRSLTCREVAVREQPVMIYPRPYARVRAGMRFGSEAIRMDGPLMRLTPLAAGIAFRAEGAPVCCSVWGRRDRRGRGESATHLHDDIEAKALQQAFAVSGHCVRPVVKFDEPVVGVVNGGELAFDLPLDSGQD